MSDPLFFKHHQGSQTKIIVDYTDINSNEGSLQLGVGGVAQINPQWSKLEPNVLFELRANHPIVDAVGLLKDSDEKQWLVFIQVSLTAYNIIHHAYIINYIIQHCVLQWTSVYITYTC